MPSAGFEPTISAIKRFETYAVDRTATSFGSDIVLTLFTVCLQMKRKC
jgi:hypothetical protein